MIFPAAVLVQGASGIIAQLLLLRELFITFMSNELSLGVVLANWLALEAAGALLGGRLIGKVRARRASFAAATLLFSLALPLGVVLARTWKLLAGAAPGEALGLDQVFIASLVILLPISLPHGALFAFACGMNPNHAGRGAPGIGRVYALETAGTLAGGLLFSFLLVTRFNSFETALGVSMVNAAASIPLLLSRAGFTGGKRHAGPRLGINGITAAGAALLLLVSAALLLGPWSSMLQRASIDLQWRGHRVARYENSVYGNIAVIEREGEYTFFSNGIPVITAPTPDLAFVEEFSHLPVLMLPGARNVLVVSGGAGGVIGELLKHPLERIDYVELDPLILRLLREYPTPPTQAELGNPRVRVHLRDGRLFLRETSRRWDLVFVGLSNPSDLQLNRFFTRQFYSLVAERLAPGGLLAFSLPGSATYMSPELRDLNACVINTLREVFAHVRIIPGDGFNLVMASASPDPAGCGADCLAGRLEESGVEARFISPAHIRYRLDPRRERRFSEAMVGATGDDNTDYRPRGVRYSLAYWNAQFSPRLHAALARLSRAGPIFLPAFFILAAVALLAAVKRSTRPLKAALPAAVAATGFTGMLMQLALIFTFQSLYGVVFQWVGLLVTAFMGGTAAGGIGMTRLMERSRRRRGWFMAVEACLALFAAALPLAFPGLQSVLEGPGLTVPVQLLFASLSFAAGLLIGAEFPLAGMIYLGESSDVGGTAGMLYGADLLGGWAGGIAGGVLLFPVLGLTRTCLLLGSLKLFSLALFAAASRREKSSTFQDFSSTAGAVRDVDAMRHGN